MVDQIARDIAFLAKTILLLAAVVVVVLVGVFWAVYSYA